jgi:hypothetical protein
MITSGLIDVLNQEGIDNTLQRVNLLSEWWIPRGIYAGSSKGFSPSQDNPVDFYTIGAASYIDDGMIYNMLCEDNVDMMDEWFEWLYECVVYSFYKEGLHCKITESLARPGFHVFAVPPGEKPKNKTKDYLEDLSATIHFDEQQWAHKGYWAELQGAEDMKVDLENCLSFTLCIAAPKNGCGLSTWGEESLKCYENDSEYTKYVKSKSGYDRYGPPDVVVPYSPGKMFYFIGPLQHQMSPGLNIGVDDARITLQGHGVKVDDVWELYF